MALQINPKLLAKWCQLRFTGDVKMWKMNFRPNFLKRTLVITTAALAILLLFSPHLTQAACTNETDCQNQINNQNSTLTTVQQQQAALQVQLNSAQANLNVTTSELDQYQQKAESLQNQLKGVQQQLDSSKQLFKERVQNFYEDSSTTTWTNLFVGSNSFGETSLIDGLNQAVIQKNISDITNYTNQVVALTAANKTAQSQLAQIQAIRNSQASQLTSIQQNNYSLGSEAAQISASIKNLTSQQQQIIAAKLAATSQSTVVGNSAPASSNPGPSPYSAGFLFLNYGYPHRIGMNQYGAYGRALAGQDFQTILQAYYGQQAVTASNLPSSIPVQGYGTISFQSYLDGLGEMPGSWPAAALQAQVIAARSYAWNWLLARPGQSICTNQNCQVYTGGDKGGAWDQAVAATAGLVLGGNNPIAAYYSSTDGGYTCTDFYHNDPCTKYIVDAAGGSWSSSTAFDGPSYGNSPWFHKAWGSYNGSAWLSATDTADVFNAAILSQYSANYNQYLSPVASGGWSEQRVIQELQNMHLPYIDQAAAVGVGMDGNGNTNSISVVGVNGDAKQLDGQFFRSIFDLRSPGTTTLFWSSLYDVQKSN